MNNKAIQILRGAKNYNPAESNEELLDGQLFYSKQTKQLYIGDDVNYKDDTTNKTIIKATKPIGAANLIPGEGFGSVKAFYDRELGPNGSGGETDRPAIGDNKYDPVAEGRNSFAMTARAFAYGDCSIAGGWNAHAYGKGDVAFNLATAGDSGKQNDDYTKKNVNGAFAANNGIAKATRSAAFNLGKTEGEGPNSGYNFAVNSSTASGIYAFAANNSTASGAKSFAIGNGIANGEFSFASGVSTGASGKATYTFGNSCYTHGGSENSISGGYITHVYSKNSIAYGKGLISEGDNQAIFGKFNKNDSNNIFEIGVGVSNSDTDRKNAFEVTQDGSINIQKDLNIFASSEKKTSIYYDNSLNALVFGFPPPIST